MSRCKTLAKMMASIEDEALVAVDKFHKNKSLLEV